MKNKITLELKKAVNLLANQYFKSFKRFESARSFVSDFDEKVKKFNQGYLKLVSAVLNSGDPAKIYASLHESLMYTWASENERGKLSEEIYWNIWELLRTK